MAYPAAAEAADTQPDAETPADLLEEVAARSLDARADEPAPSRVRLGSGRTVELSAQARDGQTRDRMVVRSPAGEIELKVEFGPAGPLLRFSAAEVEFEAARELRLQSDRITLQAREEAAISSGGDLRLQAAQDHTTRVGRQLRSEAASIEMQANEGAVRVRAMEQIALDGEHIGLNDDPLPQPFGWSCLADEQQEGGDV